VSFYFDDTDNLFSSGKTAHLMKILIVCDTDEVKATELGLYLKCEAERMNRRVVVLNAHDRTRSTENFDAIVVIGEIVERNFSEAILGFVNRNLGPLNGIPSFFIPVLPCDESNLKVSEQEKTFLRGVLGAIGWTPQQVLLLPVGVRLQGNHFVTLADWPELKMALQRFLIRNDLMMAS
jgi:menaquinone-dependent protoporphyrinogen IX oxidase